MTSGLQQKKVIMHVNKFVPFFMQFHTLGKQELGQFSKDYSAKDNAAIQKQLIDFDAKLIEVFNHRRERYIKKYYH